LKAGTRGQGIGKRSQQLRNTNRSSRTSNHSLRSPRYTLQFELSVAMTDQSKPPVERSASSGEASFQAGQKWGQFELVERVGRGSFGEVYRAWDPSLEREVGLKILLPRSADEAVQYEELLREARALAAVRHTNILPIYGVDRHDGRVGFWTDFVHGKTLAALVREQGPFGYRETALIGLDVTKALSAVHRAGLVHRDIKAENVMREEGGRILLMDFGLSALATGQQELAGSPRYMAPELFRGAEASVATDIYAVGVLLFFLVTGHHPGVGEPASSKPQTTGDEPTALASAVMTSGKSSQRAQAASEAAGRSLLDYRPDLPEMFARVIEKAIDPDAAKRFASAGALSSALSETLGLSGEKAEPAKENGKRAKWVESPVVWVLVAGVLIVLMWRVGIFHHKAAGFDATGSEAAPSDVNSEYLKADALLKRYDQKKNVTDAIDILNDVIAKAPKFALGQSGLCQAEFQEYRVTRDSAPLKLAETACNTAIKMNGDLAPPYVTLARMSAMAGNTALAMTQVQQAMHNNPRSAEAYGAQAEVFEAAGRDSDAIAAVQKAADLAPDDWRWPVLLGSYYYNDGRLADAAAQYQGAVNISPDNALALRDLGMAELQLNRLPEAEKNLENAINLEPTFTGFSDLAEIYKAEGNYRKAIEVSQEALGLNETNFMAWGNLGSAYLRAPNDHAEAAKSYQKAIELAEKARKESPQDSMLLVLLGGYYATIGDAAHAQPLLRQAVALNPDSADVLYSAGDGYELLHKRDQAIPLIAKALALGYHSVQFEHEPELAALRQDPNFKKALQAAQQKHLLDSQNKKG
jgi:eukaryotic-like serine/threonine-protein kinase